MNLYVQMTQMNSNNVHIPADRCYRDDKVSKSCRAKLSSAHKQTNISLQFDDDDNHANQGCSSETDTLNIFPNE